MPQRDLRPQHTIITPRIAHNCPLRVAPHEIVNAGAQPVEVGTRVRSGKCRVVELLHGGARKMRAPTIRPPGAPVPRNDIVQPQHFTRQAALAREDLAADEVVSVTDVDKALCQDRVALGIMRQVLLNHLGGGQGIEHFFDQFTGPTTAWWKVLGSPELNAEVRRKLTVRSSFSDCTGAFTTIRAAWKHFWSGVRPGGIIVSGSMCRTNPSDTWSHLPAFQSRSKTLPNGGPSAQSRFDPIVTPLANGRNLRILAIVSRLPSYRDRRRAESAQLRHPRSRSTSLDVSDSAIACHFSSVYQELMARRLGPWAAFQSAEPSQSDDVKKRTDRPAAFVQRNGRR